MGKPIAKRVLRSAVALTLGWVAALAAVGSIEAQSKAGSAEIKALTGRVELQKKGDTQWIPAVVGERLVEGDSIRAWAAGSARMDLPDGSTIFVAENSRVVVGKLEFDRQNRAREAIFHLAVGKVRAVVSQAALQPGQGAAVQLLDLHADRGGRRQGNGLRGHVRRCPASDTHRRAPRDARGSQGGRFVSEIQHARGTAMSGRGRRGVALLAHRRGPRRAGLGRRWPGPS